MKRNHRRAADARLEALYARVPHLDCKGLCHTSCGIIDCSTRERERLAEAGVTLPTLAEYKARDRAGETITCPALTAFGACSGYQKRPLVCRLWGAVESLPCVYGCQPEGGPLSDAEAFELIGESLADDRAGMSGAALRKAVEDKQEMVTDILRRGHQGDLRRARGGHP